MKLKPYVKIKKSKIEAIENTSFRVLAADKEIFHAIKDENNLNTNQLFNMILTYFVKNRCVTNIDYVSDNFEINEEETDQVFGQEDF